MKNFEFKSQICTSRSQSEKLLALGLKKETADMVYIPHYRNFTLLSYFKPKVLDDDTLHYMLTEQLFADYIPAWSLHRMMEIAYNGDILGCVALNFHERNIGAYYEQVIKVIEYLVNVKEFNKDYLEDKK